MRVCVCVCTHRRVRVFCVTKCVRSEVRASVAARQERELKASFKMKQGASLFFCVKQDHLGDESSGSILAK